MVAYSYGVCSYGADAYVVIAYIVMVAIVMTAISIYTIIIYASASPTWRRTRLPTHLAHMSTRMSYGHVHAHAYQRVRTHIRAHLYTPHSADQTAALPTCRPALYRLYLGVADGMSNCAGMGVPVLKSTPDRSTSTSTGWHAHVSVNASANMPARMSARMAAHIRTHPTNVLAHMTAYLLPHKCLH